MGRLRLAASAFGPLTAAAVIAGVVGWADSSAEQPEWDPVTVARAHLASNSDQPGFAPASSDDQQLLEVRESPGAVHVRLQQTLNGIPISGAVSTLSMQEGAQQVDFAVDRQLPDAQAATVSPTVSPNEAISIVTLALGLTDTQPGSAQLVYFPLGLELILSWEVRISARRPLGAWIAAVDATTGELISHNNGMSFDSGMVFDPNPAVTSGFTIPPPSNCDSPPNATTLAPQRTTKTLLGIAAAQNKLKGQYVDLTAPGLLPGYKPAGVANEVTRVYNYACNDDRFEEVMIYHHVDATQRKLQSLGFTGTSAVLASPIPAHPHWDAQCNAFYDPFTEGIYFMDGDGLSCSTDTGEDADVVVHEYGHALQDAATPGWGFNPNALLVEQARAIGEGWGDYIAGAMFGDACTGGWALNELYAPGSDCLRTMENPNVFPASYEACPDLPSGAESPHCGGLIWGGALWDLAQALGDNQSARELVLRLALDAQFYLSPLATFNDAAKAVRQADVDLYGGAHVATIDTVFAGRGLVSTGSPSDFAYYFFRIRHPAAGNLEIRLKVGSLATPLCNELIWDHAGGNADDVMGVIPISASICAGFFPPTVGQPWFLEARDSIFGAAGGYIDQFEVALSTSRRCIAVDVPVSIPDGTDVPVASMVNCTNIREAQPTVTPTPIVTNTPAPTPTSTTDSDGDGVLNAVDNCPNTPNPSQANNDASGGPFGGTQAWIADGTGPEGATTGGDACDTDDDNNGCADNTELALSPARDPLNPWDFADMWAPALPASGTPTGGRNGAVTLADALAGLTWVGRTDNGPPGPDGRDYDSDTNANGIEDGAEYDRFPGIGPGLSGPPNGAVALQDVLVAIDQVGDTC